MAVPRPEPRGYPGNLGSLVAEDTHATCPAIIDLYDPEAPREVSYRELDAACNAAARGLARAGLKPSDRIGILSLNRCEFVIALLGAMRAGVIPVPINVKLAADTVAYILRDSGAALVFTESGLRRLCPAGFNVIEFGAEFDRFLDSGPFNAFEPLPHSIAIQPYTSGSTGQPKGVLLTHFAQQRSLDGTK